MPRHSNRDVILATAHRLILQQGQFTLDELALVTKLTKGGILYHFEGVQELMEAVFTAFMNPEQRKEIQTHVKSIKRQGAVAMAFARHLL